MLGNVLPRGLGLTGYYKVRVDDTILYEAEGEHLLAFADVK